MSFELSRNISGPHTLAGGPAGDGVFFGTLPSETLPEVFISRVMVAGSFPRVVVRDFTGTSITYADETADAAVIAGTIPWPNSTVPISDRLLLGVPAGKVLKGFTLLLNTPADWSDTGLDWSLFYPTTSALTALPHSAADSDPATRLRTGTNGTLIYVELATPLSTDTIAAQPYGGTDAYERRIEVGLTGTITGGSTFPIMSRIWPVWAVDDSMAYVDYTSVLQPIAGTPSYAAWPISIVARSGDETLFGCGEWPVAQRWIVDQSSGTTGAATYRYSSTTGMKDLPAEYVNDPSDFGRSAPGTYQVRVAKPADAAKMWLLTYTLSGTTHTVFQLANPTIPAGAVQVRKTHTYFFGRRYGADSVGLVTPFNMRLACRELDPATMTSTLLIQAPDTLKTVSIDAEEATGAAGESSWFIANTRTGEGVLARKTLTLTDPSMGVTGQSLARQAGDGFIGVVIKQKPGTNTNATGGELAIVG